MKRILLPGLVGGVVMLVLAIAMGWLMSALLPSLQGEYANTALFRSWSDPIMMLYFLYPFLLGVALAWVWDKIKGVVPGQTPSARGIAFASAFWVVSSIPGILMSYSSFALSLMMVLTWLLSSLVQLLCAGVVIARMNK